MLVVQMLLPRFLVLEVLLFFHFLQQSHAALHCFTAQQRHFTSCNGTSLSKEETTTSSSRPLPVDVIVKTDRVTRSTVTISVKPTVLLDESAFQASHANEQPIVPIKCSNQFSQQDQPSFQNMGSQPNLLNGQVKHLSKHISAAAPLAIRSCHGRSLRNHCTGDEKNMWLKSILQSPEADEIKTEDAAVLISHPIQRLTFAPTYF